MAPVRWPALVVGLFVFGAPPPEASAQERGNGVEIRADLFAAARDGAASVQGGAGIVAGLSTYARGVIIGAIGGSSEGLTARAEAAVRFHTDPFKQRRWGLYGAAGAGVSWSSGSTPYLLVLVGFERTARRWAPAIEAGLGRGARLGIVLRRTAPMVR